MVATPQRLPMLPTVPTTAEDGPGELAAYLAPAGTPNSIIARLNAAIAR